MLVGVQYFFPGMCALTEVVNFRRDFDIERARETEEYEKSHPLGVSNRKNNSNAEAKYVTDSTIFFTNYLPSLGILLTWFNSIHNDCSYPKGLIVAFKLKSKSNGGSTEQNDTNDAANGVKTVSKEDGGLDSSENANKEIETMVTDDVSKGEKTTGENNEKDDKENIDENNGLGSVEKETEDVEESPEGPIEMGDEKEDKSAATVYKDDMNVVLREDLKDLFQKYGTVKVSCGFPFLFLWLRF